MTTVSEIATELGMDPKRARRILRKAEGLKHEHGASWDLDAKMAKQVRKILSEAAGVEEPAPAPAKEPKEKPAPKKEKAPKKTPAKKQEEAKEPVAA